METFVALIILVISLLIVQIIALIRMQMIIRALKKVLHEISSKSKAYNPKYKYFEKICHHCRFRQTFINADPHGSLEDFYYRCGKHKKEIRLVDYCNDFVSDSVY